MTYETDGPERLVTGHTGRVFLLLTFIVMILQLAWRILPPLLPAIIDDLGITAFLAGVALSVAELARASMEFPGGRLADQLSRSTVVLASLGFGVVAIAALSLSVTYPVFLAGVAVLGMTLGLFFPSSRTLLSDIFSEKRGRAFGLNMVGGDLAGIIASGLAIWIVSVAAWRGAFLPLLLILLPLPLAFYRLSREPIRTGSVDFGLRETGLRVFGNPSMRWLVVVYSLFKIATGGVLGFLPTFLIDVHGVSFALASSAFALLFVVGLFSRPASGFLGDLGSRPLVSGGSLAVASAGLAVMVVAPVGAAAIAGVVVYALGQKSVPPPLQAYLMERFPDESMGSDFGAFRAIYKAVGSVGPAYTGFVAHRFGFVPAFASLAGFFLLGGAILVWFSAFGWPDAA